MVAVMIQTLSEGTMPSLAYTLLMLAVPLNKANNYITLYLTTLLIVVKSSQTIQPFIFNFLKCEHLFTIGMHQELIEHRSLELQTWQSP